MKYALIALLLLGCASLKPVEQLDSRELCGFFSWRDRGDKTPSNHEYAKQIEAETMRRGLLSDQFKEQILAHHVRLGMSRIDVACAIGNPHNTHMTQTKYGVSEQWVYIGFYVYFRDDKVTAIQD